jgi:hypothetical protein
MYTTWCQGCDVATVFKKKFPNSGPGTFSQPLGKRLDVLWEIQGRKVGKEAIPFSPFMNFPQNEWSNPDLCIKPTYH